MKSLSKLPLILAAVFLGVCLLLVAAILIANRRYTGEIRTLVGRARQQPEGVVTEDMLQGLPGPVQRYLTYTGVVGKPLVSTVELEMQGRIRQDEQQPWMEFVAREFYTVEPPAFTWHAATQMAGLPLVRVRDSYMDGEGNLHVSLAGLYTMSDARGADVDQGSLMRYLNEMMWFPAAYLRANVTWEAIDDDSARVMLMDKGESVSAVLTFDEQGRLINFIAERYANAGTPDSTLERWSTPISRYGEFEGLRLPVAGSGVWHLESGDLTYIELEITAIQYNVSAP
jgi:hypothetical protein